MGGNEAPRSRTGNLPAELTSFVGRRRETTAARKLLESARLLTLTGPGGVGKTQLALRVARQARRAFPDGVWLVELAALQDSALLTQAVADALGLRDQSARSSLAVVADHLQDKQLLLVLDNCEHLLDACGVVAAKLLGAAPGLRVLATSRQLLRVEGEHLLPVGPLSVPDPERLPANVHTYEAVRLFAERAAAVAPGFEVDAANRAAVVGICHRLDGIPLAIELATARLRALSPEQILRWLDDRFRLLVGGSRAVLPRHQTLRAAIDWSFELCAPEEQALWARASVFAGGFGLDAAEVVCGGGLIEPRQVFELVTGLVDKSILAREDYGPRSRYRMLDTIRQYGQDRLREAGEEDVLRERHRDYYLGLAEQGETDWFGPEQVEVFRRTQRDHANVRIALEWCLSTPGETRTGLRLAAALHFYWLGCGYLAEGRHWLDRALALGTEPTSTRAKALWTNAHLALTQGNGPSGIGMVDECQALARQRGDETALAYALLIRGTAAMMTDDHARAVALCEEALARFTALGELNSIVLLGYDSLAMTLVFQGDLARAVTVCQQTVAICERDGERWARAYALYVLSWAEWAQGELEQAAAHGREALRLKRAFNDLFGVALIVDLLACIAAAAGDGTRAATLLGAVEQIWASLGGQARWGSENWIGPREACERQARHTLGDRAFQTAFARSTELDLDHAIAYALGEKPATTEPAATGIAELSLTRRERQVAELVAHGLTNKQIADKLVIALRTAETHVENILTKLGFTNRIQIATWMAEQRQPPAP